jgi:prepilin peptidase CpaA
LTVLDLGGLAFYAACLLAAALTDLRGRRIPNLIPLLLVAGFLILAILEDDPGRLWRVPGAAAVMALGWLAFNARVMGGGDVKLLAAAALWFPLAEMPRLVLAVALAGGIQAVVWMILAGGGRLALLDGRLPYALAIALGGVAVRLA